MPQATEGECERELLPSRQSLSTSLKDGGNGRFVNRPYSKAQANTTKEKKEQLSCAEMLKQSDDLINSVGEIHESPVKPIYALVYSGAS